MVISSIVSSFLQRETIIGEFPATAPVHGARSVANQDFREMSSTLEIVRNPRHCVYRNDSAFRPARAARGSPAILRPLTEDNAGGIHRRKADVTRPAAVSATDVIRNAPSDDSGRIGNGDSASELLIG